MIGKKFEQNNLTIALNFVYAKIEKIYPAYVSKQNLNHEKQVILLVITKEEGLKKLSILLRRITSNNNGNLYCLNCFHSFRTKNKLESHKKYAKIKSFVIL